MRISVIGMFICLSTLIGCAEEESRWPLVRQSLSVMPLDTARTVIYLSVSDSTDTLFIDYGSRIFDFEGDGVDQREFVTQSITIRHLENRTNLNVRMITLGEFRADSFVISHITKGNFIELFLEFPEIRPDGETVFSEIYTIESDTIRNIFSDQTAEPVLLYRIFQVSNQTRAEINAVKMDNQYYRKI